MKKYDVTVVGGGMVGAALASGLADEGFSLLLLEHQAPPEFHADSKPDVRISALGVASVALLNQLGVWHNVQQMRCSPYRRLETWEWSSALVNFDAQSLGLTELGYMVENSVLQQALWQRLVQQQIVLRCPDELEALQTHHDGWCLTLKSGEQASSRLVIGADGAHSRVRQLAGIGIHGWDYAQSCMLISVQCEYTAGDMTWQHFTPHGPRAFLPLYDRWASLVWYDNPARIRQLQAMSMKQLEKEIYAHFPERLGRIVPVAAGAFPLTRRHASRYVLPGLALVGDAAHTINPLAGQGVNLGYRDVNALIDTLVASREKAENWAAEEVLLRYQRQRQRDNLLMQSGMDLFHFAFSNAFAPLRVARNLALFTAQRSGVLKRQALRYALGL